MAREKKVEEKLTPEEKLAKVLVPVEEQPYPVPENWCWTTVGTIASVKGGKRVPKGKQLIEYKTDHPYIRVTDFDNRSIIVEQVKFVDDDTFNVIRNYTISVNDIYISIAGTIGKVGVIPDVLDGANLTENAAKITNIKGIEQKYLLWLLESESSQVQMKDSTISTTQPKLALFRIENLNVPLPPHNEQQRIVDRIESLFAKLDEAEEKAQAVVDSFESRKMAILHKAFTGELTVRWRKNNNLSEESWEHSHLGKYADSQYGYTASASFESIGPKFLRITDIQDGYVDWRTVPYCRIAPEKKAVYAIKRGDIVVARIGATTGKSYLIVDDVDAVYASYLIRVTLKSDKLIEKYLYLFFQSQEYWTQISEFSSGIAQPGVNGEKLRELEIPIPPLSEQFEIVRILESLLVKEQQAKKIAEATLEQIEIMKKAILARAFRGELGTNDPAEANAMELLKSTL